MPDPQKPSLAQLLGLNPEQAAAAAAKLKDVKGPGDSDTLTPWLKEEATNNMPAIAALSLAPFTGGMSLIPESLALGGAAALGGIGRDVIQHGEMTKTGSLQAAEDGMITAAGGPILRGVSNVGGAAMRSGARRMLSGALDLTPADASMMLKSGKATVNQANVKRIENLAASTRPTKQVWSDTVNPVEPSPITLTDAPELSQMPRKVSVSTGAPSPYQPAADAYRGAMENSESLFRREGAGGFLGREMIGGRAGTIIGAATTAATRPAPMSAMATGLHNASGYPRAFEALARSIMLKMLGQGESATVK